MIDSDNNLYSANHFISNNWKKRFIEGCPYEQSHASLVFQKGYEGSDHCRKTKIGCKLVFSIWNSYIDNIQIFISTMSFLIYSSKFWCWFCAWTIIISRSIEIVGWLTARTPRTCKGWRQISKQSNYICTYNFFSPENFVSSDNLWKIMDFLNSIFKASQSPCDI